MLSLSLSPSLPSQFLRRKKKKKKKADKFVLRRSLRVQASLLCVTRSILPRLPDSTIMRSPRPAAVFRKSGLWCCCSPKSGALASLQLLNCSTTPTIPSYSPGSRYTTVIKDHVESTYCRPCRWWRQWSRPESPNMGQGRVLTQSHVSRETSS